MTSCVHMCVHSVGMALSDNDKLLNACQPGLDACGASLSLDAIP